MDEQRDRFERPVPCDDPYATPETPSTLEPDPPHWSLWLVYLAFRPRLFFEVFVVESSPVLTALTAWTFGVVAAMDRLELRSITSANSPMLAVMHDWAGYWGFCAGAGVVSGALYYAIGGWWFRMRLQWSGAEGPDKLLARRVYIYSAQAYVVPYLLLTLLDTWTYPTPLAASNGDDPKYLLIIVALFWSVYVSYRGVRTVFVTKSWPARIWFLILPGILYSLVLVGFILAGLFAGAALEPEPEVDRPLTIQRERFSLDYPGNWRVNSSDPDFDPDYGFAVEPTFADAVIQFWFYDEPMGATECVGTTKANLASAYEMGELTVIDRWGSHEGSGYRGNCTIEGKLFDLTLFCSNEDPLQFEIMQIVESDAVPVTAPGFDLIRGTFVVHGP